eukprot:TRINITY_DN8964_c1_g1_i6.p2 TRINITY_DN8964_c1_g1~~TRINITY_DN8964_c1_g1_i6.p2  ORF type:complete len:100 (+),score=4.28 TRINITY_DN8964_c1_g1_i6:115-414(+)
MDEKAESRDVFTWQSQLEDCLAAAESQQLRRLCPRAVELDAAGGRQRPRRTCRSTAAGPRGGGHPHLGEAPPRHARIQLQHRQRRRMAHRPPTVVALAA